MNVLITGVLGMVGSHMVDFLLEKPNVKIYGFCRWNESLIDLYLYKWDWTALSASQNIPWSFKILKKYSRHLDWRAISSNKAVP